MNDFTLLDFYYQLTAIAEYIGAETVRDVHGTLRYVYENYKLPNDIAIEVTIKIEPDDTKIIERIITKSVHPHKELIPNE